MRVRDYALLPVLASAVLQAGAVGCDGRVTAADREAAIDGGTVDGGSGDKLALDASLEATTCPESGTIAYACDAGPRDAFGCNVAPDVLCGSAGGAPGQCEMKPHLDVSYPIGCNAAVSQRGCGQPGCCVVWCTCNATPDGGAAWGCPL